jgi:hypothetical protein
VVRILSRGRRGEHVADETAMVDEPVTATREPVTGDPVAAHDTDERSVTRDTDGDGVADERTVARDTDGDGVADQRVTTRDTDGDGVADERSVTRDTGRTVARDTDGDGVADRPAVAAPVATAAVADRDAADPDVTGPAVAEPVRPRWNRVSFSATLGLILGLTALYASLSGLLAPVGILLGVLGLFLATSGFAGARRAGITGHSLAMLGMLTSAGALVFGVLAVEGALSWLNTHTDNVPLVRDWVDAHLPWLKHW